MKSYLKSNSFTNLIKTNTCFKGAGSFVDLILTNGKYYFQYTRSHETGLSDHPHLIYSILKTAFTNTQSY